MSRISSLVVALSLLLPLTACAAHRERFREPPLHVQARRVAELAAELQHDGPRHTHRPGRNWQRLRRRLHQLEQAALRLEHALLRHQPHHRSVQRALARLERAWARLEAEVARHRQAHRLEHGLARLDRRLERLYSGCGRARDTHPRRRRHWTG